MFNNPDVVLQDQQIEKFYRQNLSKWTESLRTKLLDSPTQYSEFSKIDFTRLKLNRFLKVRQKIGLAVMSWYMPKEIQVLLQLELREYWGADYLEVMEVLLTSKQFCLTWVLRCSRWNENDFFGNVLNRTLATIWRSTDFVKLSEKPVKRYTGYCRGYQESSRRAPSPLRPDLGRKIRIPISEEEEQQKKIEQEIKLQELLRKVEREFHILFEAS